MKLSQKGVTLLYPGQGSQYVGMGKNLLNTPGYQLIKKANQVLDFDLEQIMLEGPEETLKQTKYTQPAILAHSMGLFENVKLTLEKYDIKINRVLGHSVGEYAALVSTKSLSFEDAIQAVYLRGTFMQDAVPVGLGKMIAILKVPAETILEGCEAVSSEKSTVMPANYNTSEQIVVSGNAEACDSLTNWLQENVTSPYRAMELNVSAPFHCKLMTPAATKLKNVLNEINFNKNQIPYIANIDAKEYPSGSNGENIKENLVNQVANSVLWTQSFGQLPADEICLEIGPGKVLTGLARKINREIKVIRTDNFNYEEELGKYL